MKNNLFVGESFSLRIPTFLKSTLDQFSTGIKNYSLYQTTGHYLYITSSVIRYLNNSNPNELYKILKLLFEYEVPFVMKDEEYNNTYCYNFKGKNKLNECSIVFYFTSVIDESDVSLIKILINV